MFEGNFQLHADWCSSSKKKTVSDSDQALAWANGRMLTTLIKTKTQMKKI